MLTVEHYSLYLIEGFFTYIMPNITPDIHRVIWAQFSPNFWVPRPILESNQFSNSSLKFWLALIRLSWSRVTSWFTQNPHLLPHWVCAKWQNTIVGNLVHGWKLWQYRLLWSIYHISFCKTAKPKCPCPPIHLHVCSIWSGQHVSPLLACLAKKLWLLCW